MRFAAMVAAVLVLFGTVFAHGGGQELTAEQIIQKHIAAVGGKEKLTRFKTRVAIGMVQKENEPAGKMAIMSEVPNRVSAFYAFEKFDWRLIYDGTNSIYRPTTSGALAIFIRKYQESLASGFLFNGIALYNTLLDSETGKVSFKARGTKKIDGREAYVVEAQTGKGINVKLFFDAETFMWIRTDFGQAHYAKQAGAFSNGAVAHNQDEITVDYYFVTSDFRKIDGLMLPFKFEQVITYPLTRDKSSSVIKGTITEYKHDIPIDPGMFH
jgi:hypothetical protein